MYASDGLRCAAFPDPAYPLHTLVAGLISFACSLPVASFVQSSFSLAMTTDDAQLHSRTRLLRWTLTKRLLLGRPPWVWRDGALHRTAKRMASSWCASLYDKLTGRIGDALAALAVRCARSRRAGRARIDTPMPVPGSVEERDEQTAAAAARHDRATEQYKRAGYVLVLAAWAICVWMILVYGALIYELLGPTAEATFTRSWGVSVGIGQLQELRQVLRTAAQTAAALLILEALWLSTNSVWLESMMDEASVQATLLRRTSVTLAARVRTYARFNKAVC